MAKSQLQLMQERMAYVNAMLVKGYLFVSLAELEQYRPVMPASIVKRISSAILKGEDKVPVLAKQLTALRAKLATYKEQQQRLAQCAELNNRGMECERWGDIAGAIQAYEENVLLGYPAHHAYKRLLVLYRKAKDYKNELRIAQRACRVFPKDESYKQRREKVKELIKRASSKS